MNRFLPILLSVFLGLCFCFCGCGCVPTPIDKPQERKEAEYKYVKGITLELGKEAGLDTLLFRSEIPEEVEVAYVVEDPQIAALEEGVLVGKKDGSTVLSVSVDGKEDVIPVNVNGRTSMMQLDPLTKPIVNMQFEPDYDTIRVARGETASIQMLVKTSVQTGALVPSLASFTLESTKADFVVNPKIYWVQDVTCSEKWDNWAGGAPSDRFASTPGNKFPDILVPIQERKSATSIDPSKRVAFWVEIDIPRDMPAGLYKSVINLTGGYNEVSRDVYVQVYDVSLPEKQSMTVVQWVDPEFGLIEGGRKSEMGHNLEIMKAILIPFIKQYGQNAYRLMYAVRHNTSSFTYELNPQTGKKEIKFNLSLYEKEISNMLEADPDIKAIHGYGITAGTNVNGFVVDENGEFVLGTDGKPQFGAWTTVTDVLSPEAEIYLGTYFQQLEALLKSHKLPDGRTWLDIFAQSVKDEPKDDFAPAYNAIARCLRKYAPGIKIVDAIETDKIDPTLIDYPCPTLQYVSANPAVGNQTQWIYTCIQPQGNFANRFIRIPLIKTRIVHWVNYKYNAPGYLHWGLNYWAGSKPEYDPINGDANGHYTGGDMYIIYPGDGCFYPSIRLCAMRDGIRDYDLLKMVEAKSAETADKFASRLAKDNATYNTNVADFRRLRKDILEYLEK